MEYFTQAETTLLQWYESFPHLPTGGRKWLASNVWWMALIGAILGILALVIAIPAVIIALIEIAMGGMPTNIIGVHGVTWQTLFSLILSIVLEIISVTILIKSINPVKEKVRRGWKLMFFLFVITFVIDIIDAVVLLSFWSLVNSVVFAIIGGYFLFEIRGYFTDSTKVKKAKTVKVVKKPRKKTA